MTTPVDFGAQQIKELITVTPFIKVDKTQPMPPEPMYQVFLVNDNLHSLEQVVLDVLGLFNDLTPSMAYRIVNEINEKGRTLVEVEPRSLAELHMAILKSARYNVEIIPLI